MSGLILISVALTALVGALCLLLYRQQIESLSKQRQLLKIANEQRELVRGIGIVVAEIEHNSEKLAENQRRMTVKLDHLSTDILQRDLYQTTDDRHQLAINSAKQGMDLFELVQLHGLTSDEAALIISLHSPDGPTENNIISSVVSEEISEAELV